MTLKHLQFHTLIVAIMAFSFLAYAASREPIHRTPEQRAAKALLYVFNEEKTR